MAWSRIRPYLAPPEERDEAFRQEICRLSASGLLTLGAVEIAVPLLTFLVHYLVHPEDAVRAGHMRQSLVLVTVGAATLLAASSEWSRTRARALSLVSALTGAAALIWASLLVAQQFYESSEYIPTGVTVIMLTMVAAVPLRPRQALILGLSIEAVYAASEMAVFMGMLGPADAGTPHHVFILVLTLMSTGVTAVLYGQRRSDWDSHQEALRITEALTGAQLRAQLAENAASIGKLAAALTHEINSPLGALRSSIDTMLVLAGRQATAPPEKQAALVAMQAELRNSVQSSAERIGNVVARLQRFISLEEAEVKTANLNDLISDVALLFTDRIKEANVHLEFDLRPLPTLTCRPQLLTAVFSSLLSNAINAVNGDGRIVISSRLADSLVQIRIQDNGRGMSPDEVENIFDPGFRVSEARVSSGNWSLFNIRQIIFEHGGDIHIDSAEGQGTTVAVTIPA